MYSFFEVAKEVILHPRTFFDTAKKVKGIKHPLIYYVFITLIIQVFTVFFYFETNLFARFNLELELTIATFIFFYLIGLFGG